MNIRVHFGLLSLFLTACTPRIQLDTPPEGITINMNVVVDHKIEVKMDEATQSALASPPDRTSSTKPARQSSSK